MSAQLSDKVELNINWTKLMVLSGGALAICLLLGAILRLKFLFFIADLIIFGTALFALAVFVTGLIKSKSKPKQSV
jgi:hypothetical protein